MKPIGKAEIDKMMERRGKRKPDTLRAIATRDTLLRLAARSIDGSARVKARRLHSVLLRFRSGPWRRLQAEAACPDQYRGKIEEVLFVILRTRDAVPSFCTIRNALAIR